MKTSNKTLYNKLINNISKEVKRILNEDIQDFNVVDYQDDNQNLIDHDSIDATLIRKPKNIDEENRFFEKIEPSETALEKAEKMVKKMEIIFNPLKKIKISEKCLYHNKWIFYLKGYFFIISNFKDKEVDQSWDCSVINFSYDISNDKFEFVMNSYNLAKLIEFCNLYKNPVDFYFKGYEDYFNVFQTHLQNTLKSIEIDNEYIFVGDGFSSEKFINCIDKVFEKTCFIFEEFVRFVPNYVRKIDLNN